MHKFFRIVSLLLAVTLLFSGCGKAEEKTETAAEPVVILEPVRQAREGIETLLVVCLEDLEVSADTFRNANRASFMMLMVIDGTEGTTSALQLSPDTMVDFKTPGTQQQVNAPLGHVYSYGSGGSDSCLVGSEVVSKLLGVAGIDHYMIFSPNAVGIVNDILGGVTVEITEDFTALYPELTAGETVLLEGEKASDYFCFRDENDVSGEKHMARQSNYMAAMFPPFMEMAKQEDFLTKVTMQLGEGLNTDLTLSQMMLMLEHLGSYELYEDIVTLPGTAEKVNGQNQFTIDEEAMKKTVNDLFFD